MSSHDVCLYLGGELAAYAFGEHHPFGPRRLPAFTREAARRGLVARCLAGRPRRATREELERFHTADYVDFVRRVSERGTGMLDAGDTPAFPGVFEAAAAVAGTAVDACERILAGEFRRAFVPIGGLHHARRDRAAGFCVFNDCGVALETLLARAEIRRIAYVDIDVHHGDGVCEAFDEEPRVAIADLHEDGRYLYPGSGFAWEQGRGKGAGTKLNIPMPPGSGDADFFGEWGLVERFLARMEPQFVVLQCGADSLAGDPLADLAYTPAVHAHAAARLAALADARCKGRMLALGGGGYDPDNLAAAWCAVLEAMLAR